MIARALDENNDWTFGKGKQSYKADKNALAQSLKTRLLSWKGDCFFAPADGVDWNNYLDVGTKQLLDIDIAQVVNTTPGVIRLYDYKSEVNAERRMAVSMTVQTQYGVIQVNEVQNA